MIRTEQLTVGHGQGRPPVLRDLSLSVARGELTCVLGPNGAGKSTLLRTLAGLLPARSGTVALAGETLASMTPRARARSLGVVLPEGMPSALLRVGELVALGRHPHTGWRGTLGADDRAAVARAIEQVGIGRLVARPLGALSDGERQKAMIARALAQEPALLILDEPTAFLDLAARADMLALLHRLAHGQEEGGEGAASASRGVLLSTHDLDLALRTADRVWLIHDGQLDIGVPEDLVLRGAIARAFGRPGLHFDRAVGAFRVDRPANGQNVHVVGEGDEATWTRRAFERQGWRVVVGEASGSSTSVIVRVVAETGEARWIVEHAGATSRYASIGALMDALAVGKVLR